MKNKRGLFLDFLEREGPVRKVHIHWYVIDKEKPDMGISHFSMQRVKQILIWSKNPTNIISK